MLPYILVFDVDLGDVKMLILVMLILAMLILVILDLILINNKLVCVHSSFLDCLVHYFNSSLNYKNRDSSHNKTSQQ